MESSTQDTTPRNRTPRDRNPIVAGQFYPAGAAALRAEVNGYLARATPDPRAVEAGTLLAMVPHAGYVYSGGVAGKTLGRARLSSTLLLLGPNHTGRGASLALWDAGVWRIPGAAVPVAEDLTAALLKAEPRFRVSYEAHMGEHSLEVVLPFVAARDPLACIAPLAVAEQSLDALLAAADSVAGILAAWPAPASLVVSSDMSHYLSDATARSLDNQALARVAAMDPEGLYRVVREKRITLCGMLPMVLGLAVCRALGADAVEIAAYATSGDASGDYDRVVGYAGVLVGRKAG